MFFLKCLKIEKYSVLRDQSVGFLTRLQGFPDLAVCQTTVNLLGIGNKNFKKSRTIKGFVFHVTINNKNKSPLNNIY